MRVKAGSSQSNLFNILSHVDTISQRKSSLDRLAVIDCESFRAVLEEQLAYGDQSNGDPLPQMACNDGNGNVIGLFNAVGDDLASSVTYSPFGEVLSGTPIAYGFSSQETHSRSGLVLYLFRAYDPDWGRWLNRDPVEELGGVNLYGFVGNLQILMVDIYGSVTLQECQNLQKTINTTESVLGNIKRKAEEVGDKSTLEKIQEGAVKLINNGISVSGTLRGSAELFHETTQAAIQASQKFNKLNNAVLGKDVNRRLKKNIRSLNKVAGKFKKATRSLKSVGVVGDAIDGAMIVVDLHEGDYMDATSRASGVAVGLLGPIGAAAGFLGGLIIDDQVERTEEANELLDSTGKAADSAQRKLNVAIGLKRLKELGKEYKEKDCDNVLK